MLAVVKNLQNNSRVKSPKAKANSILLPKSLKSKATGEKKVKHVEVLKQKQNERKTCSSDNSNGPIINYHSDERQLPLNLEQKVDYFFKPYQRVALRRFRRKLLKERQSQQEEQFHSLEYSPLSISSNLNWRRIAFLILKNEKQEAKKAPIHLNADLEEMKLLNPESNQQICL